MKADRYFFTFIHQYAGKYRALDAVAIWCAEYLGYVMVALIGIGAAVFRVWYVLWWCLVAGFIARFIINEAIYAFYQRKRPADFYGFEPLIKKPHHPAFPSGHAAFFLGVAFALVAYNIPLALVCIGVALVVGIARVFCGVHWPLDIIAGFGAGIMASIIMWQFIL